MLLALVHTLVAEGLHDEAFLARHCVGFERVRRYVMGESDGQPKDADWAAAITGVPAETIRSLARRMAATRTMVSASWSLQRADHGEQPYWAVILLAVGARPDRACRAAASALAMARRPASPSRRWPSARRRWRCWRIRSSSRSRGRASPTACCSPASSYDYNGKRGTYPDIRLVYWAGGNPFHHHQDTNQLRRAWQRPDTIIVHEPWWTATARHADIVLPATTTLERNDIGASHRDRYVFAMQQAIEPVGEARSDYAIFSELARRARLRGSLHARAATRWRGCAISTIAGATRCAPTRRRFRISTASGMRASWRSRGAPRNT